MRTTPGNHHRRSENGKDLLSVPVAVTTSNANSLKRMRVETFNDPNA
jgi:hypothetical protein